MKDALLCFMPGLLVGMVLMVFIFCLFSISHTLDCEDGGCESDDSDLDTESDVIPVRK